MEEKNEPQTEEQKEETKQEMDHDTVQVLCVLGYFWILFLIPLFACPKDKFARFHTNQAILLFIAETVCGIVSAVLAFIPVVGGILSGILGGVSGVLFLILLILQIVAVVQNEEKEIPVLGKYRILK